MQTYKAPLRDMRFVLHELNDSASLTSLRGMEDVSPELMDSILEEAAKLAEEVLLPINASGDEVGCVLENGVVRTPAGYKEAYQQYREGGWPAMAADPRYGGQGLPQSLNKLVEEMVCSSNLAFSLYPGLTHGAYEAIASHATDVLKDAYLPKMVDGTWAGTMCLTEAHCGTDLGMLRTKAVPQDDGSFRVSGSKIFISAGEHDLTENIIHLVLARLPDAPKGTRGISLFLVPKFLPTGDGRPGARNGVVCTALEHKMGIKGSATCQLTFEDATGWLVGEPNKGLACMFTMMNSERLSVGIQGLGAAETSYQSAVAYARDRIQGRSLSGVKAADKAADPIIVHPDVRRMLLTIRAYTEGCRALGGWVARELDVMERSNEPDSRKRAEDFTALMTPVVKALFTDLGFESTNIGMQVYGGHGYIRDHGMEQLVRDARISMIYEGTNGIQALDLVGRKLPQGAGRMLRTFFHPVNDQGFWQGVRCIAVGNRPNRGERDGGPGRGRCRGDRIPAPVWPGRPWLHVGSVRGHRCREAWAARRRRGFLQSQTDNRAFLHGAYPAPGRRSAGRDQGRQGCDDGDGRSRVLITIDTTTPMSP